MHNSELNQMKRVCSLTQSLADYLLPECTVVIEAGLGLRSPPTAVIAEDEVTPERKVYGLDGGLPVKYK